MHRFVAVINGLYAREFRVFEPLPYTGEAPVVQGAEPALPQDLYDVSLARARCLKATLPIDSDLNLYGNRALTQTSACQGFLDATIDGSGAAAATN